MATPSRQNFLIPTSTAAPAFVGEQRSKVLQLLASAVSEGRVVTLMRTLARDPSLALEQLPMKPAPLDLAVACMTHDILPGAVFAVQQGFDPSKLLVPALNQLAKGESGSANVDATMATLLAMGADPTTLSASSPSDPGFFYKAMTLAYPAEKAQHSSKLISMLLDAGCSPRYHASLNCPLTILSKTGGWDGDPKGAEELTFAMIRLVKAGAPTSRQDPSKPSPIAIAVGKRTPEVLLGLIRAGYDVGQAELGGTMDLYELLSANSLADYKPQVQQALMEREIRRAASEKPTTAAATASAPRPTRRLGAI
jgi:hypothetical protein